MLSLCVVFLYGQQKPQYTQYILNNYALNPALSGIESYTDIKICHRQQWVSLEGAPVTSYLTINFPVGKKDERNSPTALQAESDNPYGDNYTNDYTASPAHHGIGFQLFNDRIGPFNDFSAMVTYAYHKPLSLKSNLAAGLGLGFSNLSLNTSKLFFGNAYPVDPAVKSSEYLNKTRMNMNAGLWYYSSKYFGGIAVQELLPQKIDFSNNLVKLTDGKWVPHFFMTAGFRYPIDDDFNVIPSVMIKYINPVPMQTEFNVKFMYHYDFWAGATYRFQYGYAAFAGVNLMNFCQVSYAYDYTTTTLNTVSKGTHEILLGFTIGKKSQGLLCPRNVW